MSTTEPDDVIEVAVDMKIHDLYESVTYLNAKRTDNVARRFIQQNADELEIVRNQLTRILDDVRAA